DGAGWRFQHLPLETAGLGTRLPSELQMAAPYSFNTILRVNVSRQSGNCRRLHRSNPTWPGAELPLGKQPIEDTLNFGAVLRRVIPVDGALEPVAKRNFRLPSEQLLRQRIVGNTVQRTHRHVRACLDLRFMLGELANHVRAIQ